MQLFAKLNSLLPVHEFARELTQCLEEKGFTADGLAEHLGPNAINALYRGEPGAVAMATSAGSHLDKLIRYFLLHDPCTFAELSEVLSPNLASALVDSGVAIADDDDTIRICLDIRPHNINSNHYWVFSDVDAALVPHIPGPEHVLGVGAASLSLLQSTPRTPVDRVLDLGTGSGVQILGQLECAETIVATDVHPRALELAKATVAANSAEGKVELLQGSWFEPVCGQLFDRIVANPPFVVGLPEVGHVYRDSGLNLDEASELVVSRAPEYLAPGGTAHLLAAWVHQDDIPWQQRVASWLPDTGIRAWIIQRDVAEPELYVSTWLKDESVDIRTPLGREKAELWLEHFKKNKVNGVGFGFVAIERIKDDEPSDILAEDMPQSFSDPLGPEVEDYFARVAWLSTLAPGQLENSHLSLRPGVAKEEISLSPDYSVDFAAAGSGFSPAALRLTRTDGPRWSHDVDEHLVAIVAGLNPQGLNFKETVGLYAAVNDFDEEELFQSAIPAVVDLIRHGLLIPAELMEMNK